MSNIILSYHTLMQRDSREIGRGWKWTIIVVLFGIVYSSFVVYFTLHSLMLKFNMNPILNADLAFFTDNETIGAIYDGKIIDEHKTHWGSRELNDYAKFLALYQGVLAIVWICFFCMCGVGGKKATSLPYKDVESWQIVMPSTIFFGIMSIFSFLYYSILESKLRFFCDQFKLKLPAPDAECDTLIQQFEISQLAYSFLISLYYKCTLIYSLLVSILWFIVLFIMVLRIVLIIDFRLIRVIVTRVDDVDQYEYEESSTILENVEISSIYMSTKSYISKEAIIYTGNK